MRRPTILEFCQVFYDKLSKNPEMNTPEVWGSDILDFIHVSHQSIQGVWEVYPTPEEYVKIVAIINILFENTKMIKPPNYEFTEPCRVDEQYPTIKPDIHLWYHASQGSEKEYIQAMKTENT